MKRNDSELAILTFKEEVAKNAEELTWNDAMEKAVEDIAEHYKKSERKKKFKLSIFRKLKIKVYPEIVEAKNIKEELEEIKSTPLICRQNSDKSGHKIRKNGVAERNETDRKFVYKTISYYTRHSILRDMFS